MSSEGALVHVADSSNNQERPVITTLGVFAGSGFHDTAVEMALDALGFDALSLGYVERGAEAAATLLARMENQTLGRAPVWCDCISTLDARPLRGRLDLLIASPPCQPYSSAGKRRGNADERSHGADDAPLPHLVRIIDESQPALVWFENVPEWFTGGHFRSFGDELCDLGYDFAQPVFATSAGLGNVQERERGFILGYTECALARLRATRKQGIDAGFINGRGFADAGVDVGRSKELRHAGRRESRDDGQDDGHDDAFVGASGQLAGPQSRGLGESGQSPRGNGLADGGDGIMGCSSVARREGRKLGDSSQLTLARASGSTGKPSRSSVRTFDRPLCPPARNDYRRWAELVAQGLDPSDMPAIERGVSVVADALAPSASDLLRIGGNGVDALVVAYAFLRSWFEAFDRD